MKTHTIIAGINGVGKSSLTGILHAETSNIGIIIEDDEKSIELIDDSLKKEICLMFYIIVMKQHSMIMKMDL